MMMTLFLALAAAAPPATSETPERQKPITVTGEREKPVCRMERTTGSVLPTRVCVTPAQQRQMTEQALRAKERIINQFDSEENVRRQDGR